jgi:MYXO-CTERM domain-containing protein
MNPHWPRLLLRPCNRSAQPRQGAADDSGGWLLLLLLLLFFFVSVRTG